MTKNQGITTPCPECKGILIRNCIFTGEANFEAPCYHCGQVVKVCLGQKMKIEAKKICKKIKKVCQVEE